MILLLAVVAVGYFAYSAFGDTLLSHRLTRDEEQIRAQIDQLTQQQQDLEGLRDYLQTDDYVEGVARRVLGLVRPGETLYVVESDAQPTPAGTPAASDDSLIETWWERLYRR